MFRSMWCAMALAVAMLPAYGQDVREELRQLQQRIQQLEKRLSEALGDQAWRESGLGAPADIDALNHKITNLDQHVTDLRLQLEERDGELAAARAANRELMARLNATARR